MLQRNAKDIFLADLKIVWDVTKTVKLPTGKLKANVAKTGSPPLATSVAAVFLVCFSPGDSCPPPWSCAYLWGILIYSDVKVALNSDTGHMAFQMEVTFQKSWSVYIYVNIYYTVVFFCIFLKIQCGSDTSLLTGTNYSSGLFIKT